MLWRQVQLPFAPFRWGLDRDLLSLALPAAGERLMMRAGDIVIIAIVAVFGTRAVAGNAIGEVLTQFNYMPAFGIATATVMLVAKVWARMIGKVSSKSLVGVFGSPFFPCFPSPLLSSYLEIL